MAPLSTSNPISNTKRIFNKKEILSISDLKRLTIKRTYPTSLSFKIQDIDNVNNASLKKATKFLSKRTRKLTNPPIKHTLQRQPILTRHLTSLQIKPEDAAKYISQITYRFSRLNHFAILDDKDSFAPIKPRHKVNPMRYLKTFIYDHEFCRDFMRCARYAINLKIRKTSLDLDHLKRLQRLQNIQILLKTKYLSLPEDDRRYTKELGSILMAAPRLKNVVLDQEIDPENHPYIFLELSRILQSKKVNVDLIADFVDVSKSKDVSLERIIQNITDYGIRNLYVNYVGVMRDVKRFGRSFYGPIHIRKELYVNFLKTVYSAPFKKVRFSPIVDSSYIDSDLKNTFVELMRGASEKKSLPKLTLIYHLDTIETESLDLMLELYDEKICSYEITIIGNSLKRGLLDKIESHFTCVFNRISHKAEIALKLSAKNLCTLKTCVQILTHKVNLPTNTLLNVKVTESISNAELKTMSGIITNSNLYRVSKEFYLEFRQKENPKSQDLFDLVSNIVRSCSRYKKLRLVYHNTLGGDQILRNTFDRLRLQYNKVEFSYEMNKEDEMFE